MYFDKWDPYRIVVKPNMSMYKRRECVCLEVVILIKILSDETLSVEGYYNVYTRSLLSSSYTSYLQSVSTKISKP